MGPPMPAPTTADVTVNGKQAETNCDSNSDVSPDNIVLSAHLESEQQQQHAGAGSAHATPAAATVFHVDTTAAKADDAGSTTVISPTPAPAPAAAELDPPRRQILDEGQDDQSMEQTQRRSESKPPSKFSARARMMRQLGSMRRLVKTKLRRLVYMDSLLSLPKQLLLVLIVAMFILYVCNLKNTVCSPRTPQMESYCRMRAYTKPAYGDLIRCT